MSNDKIVEKLVNLAQLDIDAILAYNQAIENIEEEDVRRHLIEFRAEHDQHVTDLSVLIKRFGGQPPAFERDFKGFLIEGMTAISSHVGTRAALIAMLGNEALTNARYNTASRDEFPTDVLPVVERGYADEQRHIRYIRDTLREKFGMVEMSDNLSRQPELTEGYGREL